MLNTNKIKGRMRELGIVQADVAKRLKLAEPMGHGRLCIHADWRSEPADQRGRIAGAGGVMKFPPFWVQEGGIC